MDERRHVRRGPSGDTVHCAASTCDTTLMPPRMLRIAVMSSPAQGGVPSTLLDQFDRQVIERDVRGEIERAERVGDFDPLDLGVWRALLTWIEAQP